MHIISTQRFRLPVRRYVIDLFGIEMNPELVSTFMDCAQALKASPTQKATKLQVSQSDMFANLGRSGHDSGSESEGDEFDPAAQNTTTNGKQPVLAPKPVHKVVGFNA
jgi:rapamycin-insensitive companion of mTOR